MEVALLFLDGVCVFLAIEEAQELATEKLMEYISNYEQANNKVCNWVIKFLDDAEKDKILELSYAIRREGGVC